MNIPKVTDSGLDVGAVQTVQSRPVAAQAQPQVPVSDSISLSPNVQKVASYVSQLQNSPEVRQEIVSSYKDMVQNGAFPPPAIIEGMAKLIGTAAKPD